MPINNTQQSINRGGIDDNKSIKYGGNSGGGGDGYNGAMKDSGVTIKSIKNTQQSINYGGLHKDNEGNHNG